MVFARTPYECFGVCVYMSIFAATSVASFHTTRRSASMYCNSQCFGCCMCVARNFCCSFALILSSSKRSLVFSQSLNKNNKLYTLLHTQACTHTRIHVSTVRQELVAVAVAAATTITTAISARARLPTQPTTFTAHKSAVLIFTFSSFRIPSNIQVFFRVFASFSACVRVSVWLYGRQRRYNWGYLRKMHSIEIGIWVYLKRFICFDFVFIFWLDVFLSSVFQNKWLKNLWMNIKRTNDVWFWTFRKSFERWNGLRFVTFETTTQ